MLNSLLITLLSLGYAIAPSQQYTYINDFHQFRSVDEDHIGVIQNTPAVTYHYVNLNDFTPTGYEYHLFTLDYSFTYQGNEYNIFDLRVDSHVQTGVCWTSVHVYNRTDILTKKYIDFWKSTTNDLFRNNPSQLYFNFSVMVNYNNVYFDVINTCLDLNNIHDFTFTSTVHNTSSSFTTLSFLTGMNFSEMPLNESLNYEQGYTDGYNSVNTSTYYEAGYAAGYADGLNEHSTLRLDNYLFAIADIPFYVMRQFFNDSLFGGPSLFVILMSLVTIGIIVTLVKKFL